MNNQLLRKQTLYVATGNAGKLRDFALAADELGGQWNIEALPGLDAIAAPVEDGDTFAANAQLKALYYARHAPGAFVVADDSGLVVDALAGAPGVYSARYAERMQFPADGYATPDARNNACLLAQLVLAGATQPQSARYRCVLAVARDTSLVATAHGAVEGELLPEPRGTAGFGYDPLFFVPQHGRTMAELDASTRLALSHRGRALRMLLPLLPGGGVPGTTATP